MSYFYPTTADEFYRYKNPFEWKQIKDAYLYGVPRISFFFSIPIFYLGKWFFVLVNPLIQSANCLCLFYIVFLRRPNIKELKDMPYFLIFLCMSIFFVIMPTDVLFWISGTYNYSWILFFFLLSLCFLRQIYAQRFLFTDSLPVKILFFILGFIVGMSNESLSPVALCLTLCFALFCNYKRIKTPRALSYLIYGLTMGLFVFFAAPANYYKMTIMGFEASSSIPISKKLFFQIFHIDVILRSLFYVPFLVFIGGIICLLDRKTIKSSLLYYSLIFLFLGFVLIFLLAFASPPYRAYYSASVMFVLSFLFFVKYITDTYKFNFVKLFCFLIAAVSLYLTPRFVYPQYYLHVQEKERYAVLNKNPDAAIKPYVFLKGPTENLTVMLIDWANKIKVGEGQYIVITSEPINW